MFLTVDHIVSHGALQLILFLLSEVAAEAALTVALFLFCLVKVGSPIYQLNQLILGSREIILGIREFVCRGSVCEEGDGQRAES